MTEEQLAQLIREMLDETSLDDRYGTWVQLATDKNCDQRIITLTDFHNWLTLRNPQTPPDKGNK